MLERKKGESVFEFYLRYFNLSDWWRETFSDGERKYIAGAHRYKQWQERDCHVLEEDDEGAFEAMATSETVADFLWQLCLLFDKPKDRRILDRIVAGAEKHSNALDLHFGYQQLMGLFYRQRGSDPSALDAAIVACERQIATGSQAAKAFKQGEWAEMWRDVGHLPAHEGYRQLAIIRAKQGNYAEAIRIARQALQEGWDGDWEERIVRYERLLAKARSSVSKPRKG